VCRVAVRTFVIGLLDDFHYSLAIATPVMVCEIAFAIKLLRHMRTVLGRRNCFGQHHTRLSNARLRVRLQYLMAKYADHAAYWQFVLWARQLALIIINSFHTRNGRMMVLAEAFATLGVLIASLILHCHVQPYAYRHQNVLETRLAACSILAVAISVVLYTRGRPLGPVPVAVFEASIVGMLLGPVVVLSAWLAVGGQYQSHTAKPSAMHTPLLSVNAPPSDGTVPPAAEQPSAPAASSVTAMSAPMGHTDTQRSAVAPADEEADLALLHNEAALLHIAQPPAAHAAVTPSPNSLG